MYYVYILKSKLHDFHYTGSTDSLKIRLREHNTGLVKSTKNKKPYKIVWYCGFEDKKLALEFEKYLKVGSGKAFAKKRLLKTD